VYCIASRLMVTAFAAYLLGSLSHDQLVTWVIVAVSVVAVLLWSRRRRSGGRWVGERGGLCLKQRESSAPMAVHVPVGTSNDQVGRA